MAQAKPQLLIFTMQPDYELVASISSIFSIILCVASKSIDDYQFSIMSTETGETDKLLYPASCDQFSIGKCVSEFIDNKFGVPQLIDFDLNVSPKWLATYFSGEKGTKLITRYDNTVIPDPKFSWILGTSELTLVSTTALYNKIIVSYPNPMLVIPDFERPEQKKNFYVKTYKRILSFPHSSMKTVKESLRTDLDLSLAKKKVLLINYFSSESSALGAVRTTYWHEFISSHSDGQIDTFLLSAQKFSESLIRVYPVRDKTVFNFSCNEDWLFFESTLNFQGMLQAATWTLSVFKFLTFDILSKFDSIIISGNPFHSFNLPALIKNRYPNLKLPKFILDYRDPFAGNTRLMQGWRTKQRAKKIEREWNKSCEHILVVNPKCSSLVVGDKTKVSVIENGFDETKLSKASSFLGIQLEANKIHFVYAGSVYYDRNIVPLIKALDETKHVLHIAGKIGSFQEEILKSNAIRYHGILSYSSTIELIKKCDVGVLLLSGMSFVSTTKVYDYIACGKHILALSPDVSQEETFLTDFEKYNSKVLIKNETIEIQKYLHVLNPNSFNCATKNNFHEFSRAHSTNKLIQLLLKL